MPGKYLVLSLNCGHLRKVPRRFGDLMGMGSNVNCWQCKTLRAVVYKYIEVR